MGIGLNVLTFLATSFSSIMADFVQLIVYPECCLNSSNAAKSKVMELSISVRYIKRSPAKAETIWDVFLIRIGAVTEFCLRCCSSGSRQRINRLGERPQVCLVPRKIGKGLEFSPFVLTMAEGLVYRTCTNLINLSPSRNHLSTAHRYYHSSL